MRCKVSDASRKGSVHIAPNKLAQEIGRRGPLDIAKRVLQTCGPIMRYTVAHDFAKHIRSRRADSLALADGLDVVTAEFALLNVDSRRVCL